MVDTVLPSYKEEFAPFAFSTDFDPAFGSGTEVWYYCNDVETVAWFSFDTNFNANEFVPGEFLRRGGSRNP